MTMLVPLPAPFVNDAGKIQNIFEAPGENEPARGVSIIECKAGSRRSSHYHKTDWHVLYVASGAMRYTERRVGSGTIVKFTVRKGEAVRTGPRVEHWTEFDEDTVLISVSKRCRSPEEHAKDEVDIPWIDESEVGAANDNAAREQA